MDVMYHLVEDEMFNQYVDYLCGMPSKYVAVFATDFDTMAIRHCRNRAYSQVLINKYGLKLLLTQALKSDKYWPDGERPFKVFSR